MGLFGKKKPSLPAWKCAKCSTEDDGDRYGFARQSKDKPEWCIGCVFYTEKWNKKIRKRTEELAALIAGRLAKDFPALRDPGSNADIVAAEAFKIAKAIINQPGEGRGYMYDDY